MIGLIERPYVKNARTRSNTLTTDIQKADQHDSQKSANELHVRGTKMVLIDEEPDAALQPFIHCHSEAIIQLAQQQ